MQSPVVARAVERRNGGERATEERRKVKAEKEEKEKEETERERDRRAGARRDNNKTRYLVRGRSYC